MLEFTTIVRTVCFVNSNGWLHTDYTIIVSLTTVYDLSRIQPLVPAACTTACVEMTCAWARPAVCAAEWSKRMLASGLPITRAPCGIAYN